MEERKTAGWLLGLLIGVAAGTAAATIWSDAVPVSAVAAWALAGAFAPYAWLHRDDWVTKNIAVFVSALLVAAPFVPFWLTLLALLVVVGAWWVWDLVRRVRRGRNT